METIEALSSAINSYGVSGSYVFVIELGIIFPHRGYLAGRRNPCLSRRAPDSKRVQGALGVWGWQS